MVLAIVLGAISGVLGFLPLYGGLQMSKKVTRTSNFGYAGTLLLSVFVSFVILVGTLIVCVVLARDMVVPFVAAEAIALVVTAVIFGIMKRARRR